MGRLPSAIARRLRMSLLMYGRSANKEIAAREIKATLARLPIQNIVAGKSFLLLQKSKVCSVPAWNEDLLLASESRKYMHETTVTNRLCGKSVSTRFRSGRTRAIHVDCFPVAVRCRLLSFPLPRLRSKPGIMLISTSPVNKCLNTRFGSDIMSIEG